MIDTKIIFIHIMDNGENLKLEHSHSYFIESYVTYFYDWYFKYFHTSNAQSIQRKSKKVVILLEKQRKQNSFMTYTIETLIKTIGNGINAIHNGINAKLKIFLLKTR